MKIEEIETKVNQFLNQHMLLSLDNLESFRNTNLFDAGLIDSFGLVELVSFLEKTFCIKIEDSDIADMSLVSIQNIVDTVNRKMK
jgi:acyl carrier protein